MSSSIIPLHRYATVASAGLVAFLAFWQGIFSLISYRPCAVDVPGYILHPNPQAALTEFGISIVAVVVMVLGAQRLRQGFAGAFGYYLVIISLLVGQGLLAFVFLRLSTCAA